MIHFSWLILQSNWRYGYIKRRQDWLLGTFAVIDGLSLLIVSCFEMEGNGLITIPFCFVYISRILHALLPRHGFREAFHVSPCDGMRLIIATLQGDFQCLLSRNQMRIQITSFHSEWMSASLGASMLVCLSIFRQPRDFSNPKMTHICPDRSCVWSSESAYRKPSLEVID